MSEPASIAERLLNARQYKGFAATEFAEDATSGRYYLLETNPRLFLPTQLALDANVNLIQTAYWEMSDQQIDSNLSEPQVDGVHWIDFHSDFRSFLKKHRESKISVWEWLRSIPRASSYATFALWDLKPFLASSLEMAGELKGMLRRWLGRWLRKWKIIADRG